MSNDHQQIQNLYSDLDRWDERSRLDRLWDCLSQTGNVLFFDGMCDETISSRAWRMRNSGSRMWRRVKKAAELIFWISDRGRHCQLAHDQDLERWDRRMRAVKAAKEKGEL